MRRFNARNLALARLMDPGLRILTRCLGLGAREPVPPDSQVRSVIVFEFYFLGDVVMATPALRSLRQRFPGAEITLLGPAAAAGLERHLPWIDRMITFQCPWSAHRYDLGTLLRACRLIRRLRSQPWDLAVELRGDLRNILLACLIRARRRVSFAITGGEYWLTGVVPYDDAVLKHQVEGNLEVVKSLGCDISENLPELRTDADTDALAARYLQLFRRPVIGVHPSASKAIKLWEVGKWGRVIQGLIHDAGAEVVILHGPQPTDGQLAWQIHRQTGFADRCHVFSRSLSELIALIARLDLLISLDSAAAHIAAAVQTPFLTLFGPQRPELTRPYHFRGRVLQQGRCVCTPWTTRCRRGVGNRCMDAIQVWDVLDAAGDLLRQETAVPSEGTRGEVCHVR